MAEIKITVDNFEQEVIQSEQPVLVDFWAAWCGPCRMGVDPVKNINSAECIRCGDCARVCPAGAIRLGFTAGRNYGIINHVTEGKAEETQPKHAG